MGRDIAKIEALQRLDLEDLNNIQTFVTEYLNAALGGLFGYTRGLLTPPHITAQGGAISLKTFQVAISSAGVDTYSANGVNPTSDVKLEVVRFDPSDEGHILRRDGNNFAVNSGSISTFGVANGSFLCVEAVDIDQDSANRVFWNIASGAETTDAVNTTTRKRLIFRWRVTVGDIGNNEAPILTLVDQTTKRCRLISAWDDYRTWKFLREDSDGTDTWHDYTSLIGVSGLLSENLGPNPSNVAGEGVTGPTDAELLDHTRDLGLNMLLAYTRSRLRRMVSDGGNDNSAVTPGQWHDEPSLSLAGLKYELDNGFKRRYFAIIRVEKDTVTHAITATKEAGTSGFNLVTGNEVVPESFESREVDNSNNPLAVHVLKFNMERSSSDDDNITFEDAEITFTLLNEDPGTQNSTLGYEFDAGLAFMATHYFQSNSPVFGSNPSRFRFAIAPTKPHFYNVFQEVDSSADFTEFKFMVTISAQLTAP